MRLFLLAFVAGCWWLQQQGSLPRGSTLWWMATAGGVAAALALRLRAHRPGWARLALLALSLLAGFGWAAWRAEVHLAERLAPGLEGADLVLSGVVAGLPAQAARGQRFAFALD